MYKVKIELKDGQTIEFDKKGHPQDVRKDLEKWMLYGFIQTNNDELDELELYPPSSINSIKAYKQG